MVERAAVVFGIETQTRGVRYIQTRSLGESWGGGCRNAFCWHGKSHGYCCCLCTTNHFFVGTHKWCHPPSASDRFVFGEAPVYGLPPKRKRTVSSPAPPEHPTERTSSSPAWPSTPSYPAPIVPPRSSNARWPKPWSSLLRLPRALRCRHRDARRRVCRIAGRSLLSTNEDGYEKKGY